MREIKFRAWDKKDKIMREVYGIQFPKISNHGNRENTIVEMHCSDYDGQKAIILSDFTDSVDRVQLMQYAGLKDKNGKEIYEGDVMRRSKDGDAYHFVIKVSFSGGCFKGTTYPAAGDGPYTWPLETAMEMKGAEYDEVIGNIYETPELLK